MMRTCALILAAFAASTLNWSAPATSQPSAASEHRLSKITVRTVGEGAPVVLIPGLASSPAVYDDVAARFSKNHRLIFVQVNGFAGSKAADSAIDNLVPGAVDDLAGWLAANKIEKPAIIGHSMGGLMAMMLAKKQPSAAGKLLIVDALPFYGMLFGPTATPDSIRPFVEQMRASLVNGTAPVALPPHMSNNAAGKARILEWLKSSEPKITGEALVEVATTDFRSDFPALAKVPVTVLYAVASTEFKPVADGLYRDAYKALPGVKLVPIDNSEHFIMLDQPRRFVDEVEAFLR
jgi:pimeloyl-ACP methyl ester carboxylesterase